MSNIKTKKVKLGSKKNHHKKCFVVYIYSVTAWDGDQKMLKLETHGIKTKNNLHI